jgi:FkbH-like protein
MGNVLEEFNKIQKITTIITDLDNTFWQGILAEKQKLKLNEDYYNFLLSLYKKGIQLFVVSKNDEENVLDSFKTMKINLDKFTAIIANWDPKYLNIERLIQQTNIRPETVVFIDDNPLERTEVKNKVSAINCLDYSDWEILKDVSFLKEKEEQSSDEIQERINRYRTAIKANQLKGKFKTEDEEFLKSLKRELSIGEISFENVDRFTRLLVVTHRINFNPEKFKEYDNALDYLYKKVNEGYKLFAVSTKENDIALGLTGALVVKIEDKKAIVEDATFSCGIIGRDFEQKSIIALIDLLKKSNIKEIEFWVKLTSTNKRVKEIFEELGILKQNTKSEMDIYSLSLDKFKPKKKYEWIKVSNFPPEMDHNGIPSVIKFFNDNVKPLIKKNFEIANLGAAKGEVLGHLKKEVRDEFYEFLKNNKIKYNKIDLEFIPEEKNLVGNAEDLSKVIKNESQDLVLAIELLEHVEHFWNVINETIRICKKNGYILITVPSFNYPKHEYPIDSWRLGPKVLQSFFPESDFKIIKKELEGNIDAPRRTMILVQKLKSYSKKYGLPANGKTDWETGLTIFP